MRELGNHWNDVWVLVEDMIHEVEQVRQNFNLSLEACIKLLQQLLLFIAAIIVIVIRFLALLCLVSLGHLFKPMLANFGFLDPFLNHFYRLSSLLFLFD